VNDIAELHEKKYSMACLHDLLPIIFELSFISLPCECEKSQIEAELSSRPEKDDMPTIVSISGWENEKNDSSGLLFSAKKH